MGTFIRIVETVSSLKDKYIHDYAVNKATENEATSGFVVVSAMTTVTVMQYNEILRTTTIVFAPGTQPKG